MISFDLKHITLILAAGPVASSLISSSANSPPNTLPNVPPSPLSNVPPPHSQMSQSGPPGIPPPSQLPSNLMSSPLGGIAAQSPPPPTGGFVPSPGAVSATPSKVSVYDHSLSLLVVQELI